MDCKRFLQTGAFALALMITSTSASAQSSSSEKASRLSLGGYGEAVMTRNFYSDNIYRYTRADDHKSRTIRPSSCHIEYRLRFWSRMDNG